MRRYIVYVAATESLLKDAILIFYADHIMAGENEPVRKMGREISVDR